MFANPIRITAAAITIGLVVTIAAGPFPDARFRLQPSTARRQNTALR